MVAAVFTLLVVLAPFVMVHVLLQLDTERNDRTAEMMNRMAAADRATCDTIVLYACARVRHAVTSMQMRNVLADIRIAADIAPSVCTAAHVKAVETAAVHWYMSQADNLAASNPWRAIEMLDDAVTIVATRIHDKQLQQRIVKRRADILAGRNE